jgi:HEAT repeat protein
MSVAEPRAPTSRTSFVMRVPPGTAPGALSVDALRDPHTLVLLVRAGSLAQRRAAVARIGTLLADETMPADWHDEAVEVLSHVRRFELSHDVSRVLRTLPGSVGRNARTEIKSWTDLCTRVERQVVEFWDGDDAVEPIGALSAEERALLLTHARALPDAMAQHLAALIEDSAGPLDRAQHRALVLALEHAGDPRLLPSLRCLIEGRDPMLLAPAARALARIEDPRTQPTLREAYERVARTEDRLALAGALGAVGDARGLSFVREALTGGDPASLPWVLGALAEIGTTDDVQRMCEMLERDDDALVRAAVLSLARVADGRALVPLAQLRQRTRRSALRAEIEEAETAIHARMELLGEEAPPPKAASATWDTTRMAALARTRDPASVRVRARLNYWLGHLWHFLGSHTRAIARFEAAATLRAGWVMPVIAIAMLRTRHNETALSLAAFRRAVEIDRSYVEGHGPVITAMAQAFLRRAESVEREGRLEIARGLVEEISAHDLRAASARVRFALRERKQAHDTQRSA